MSIVVKVENLGKKYHMGVVGYGTLREELSNFWSRIRPKNEIVTTEVDSTQQKKTGDFWALKDVSFELHQGDRIGIIGRNGAGKSTLLKILSRITAPTTGKVMLRGKVVSLLEVGTGFHPELTGRENVFLNGAILGMRRREIQRKFDEIHDFSGIKDFIDTPVKRYSSGMYVRLAFSVAAHLDADIMILDEVLSVGDSDFQRKCVEKIEGLNLEMGRTIMFVSHGINQVSRICNKGLYLANGTTVLQGPIEPVVREYLQLGVRVSREFVFERTGEEVAVLTRGIVKNVAGIHQDVFSIGDDCVVELEVSVSDLKTEYMVAIQLESSDGLAIGNIIDRDVGLRAITKVGTTVIRILLRDIRLYPDDYYISLWLGDRESRTIQHHQRVLKLEIKDGGRLTDRHLPKEAGRWFFTPEWAVE